MSHLERRCALSVLCTDDIALTSPPNPLVCKGPLELLCVVRALLKKMQQRIFVGDFVTVSAIDWVASRGSIHEAGIPRNIPPWALHSFCRHFFIAALLRVSFPLRCFPMAMRASSCYARSASLRTPRPLLIALTSASCCCVPVQLLDRRSELLKDPPIANADHLVLCFAVSACSRRPSAYILHGRRICSLGPFALLCSSTLVQCHRAQRTPLRH